jgi:hypothetical protein
MVDAGKELGHRIEDLDIDFRQVVKMIIETEKIADKASSLKQDHSPKLGLFKKHTSH